MMMPTRRMLARGAIVFATAFAVPAAGWAQEAPASAKGFHSQIGLVAAGPDAAAPARLAGLVIRLDPGYKTYWRHPGESGLPPAFDWAGSTNVVAVEVLWPAPSRLEDAAGVSYGYQDGVVLPLRVTPHQAGEPVRLALKIDYGVCKDICIPGQARLALTLPAAGGGERPEVRAALARVPERQPLAAPGPLAVLALEPASIEGKPMVTVTVRTPEGPQPNLFVEAPDGWFFGPAVATRSPTADGKTASFLVEVAERPKDASGPLPLRLTLVAGGRAVETEVSLDSWRLPR